MLDDPVNMLGVSGFCSVMYPWDCLGGGLVALEFSQFWELEILSSVLARDFSKFSSQM